MRTGSSIECQPRRTRLARRHDHKLRPVPETGVPVPSAAAKEHASERGLASKRGSSEGRRGCSTNDTHENALQGGNEGKWQLHHTWRLHQFAEIADAHRLDSMRGSSSGRCAGAAPSSGSG